jgi:hypothetical protein
MVAGMGQQQTCNSTWQSFGAHAVPSLEKRHVPHAILLSCAPQAKNEYDKVIAETEAAYLKILESSQTLLTVLKREAINIQKKRQASS